MSVDLYLHNLIYQITADLEQQTDYYIIYCHYYFFFGKASEQAPVLFHKDHIFRVELLATEMLCDRMPAKANATGVFTICIPFDQIHKITRVDPDDTANEQVLFLKH